MKKTITKNLLFIVISALIFSGVVDFVKYPECYLISWESQLKTDLINNDAEAVKYYTNNYVNNNRDLFGDNFAIVKNHEGSGANL